MTPRARVPRSKGGRGRRVSPTPEKSLRALRKEIERIDRDIVRLVASRLRAARAIGNVKAQAGLPIRDFQTEKEVRARAAHLGQRLRVERALVESVFASLIEGAVREQEEIQETPYDGDLRRVLVVGGRGKMGRWLARFFRGQGHAVMIFDPAGRLEGYTSARTLRDGLEWAEIALVATPLESARETLGSILAERPDALVADIFSLKTPVIPLLREATQSGLRVASIHPLFGPDAVLLAGRTLLICETGDAATAREVRSFFTPTSLTIHAISLEEHDRAMAVVLGLSHAVNLIFARALLKTGRSFAELAGVASTTFWKQARTAMEVASENPRLYHAIQHENRESAWTLSLLVEAAREFNEAALAADCDEFVREMERARSWFSGPQPKGRASAPRR